MARNGEGPAMSNPAQHLFARVGRRLEGLDRRRALGAAPLGLGEHFVWRAWRWLRGLRYGRPSRA